MWIYYFGKVIKKWSDCIVLTHTSWGLSPWLKAWKNWSSCCKPLKPYLMACESLGYLWLSLVRPQGLGRACNITSWNGLLASRSNDGWGIWMRGPSRLCCWRGFLCSVHVFFFFWLLVDMWPLLSEGCTTAFCFFLPVLVEMVTGSLLLSTGAHLFHGLCLSRSESACGDIVW